MLTTAPPAAPKAAYLDRATLATLVRAYQAGETVGISPGLAAALVQIAGGVWDRYRFTTDRDDFVQDVFLHLMQRPLLKADPSLNLFSYFTTCSIRFGMKLRDKAYGDRRRFETYAAECVEAGRQIPERE